MKSPEAFRIFSVTARGGQPMHRRGATQACRQFLWAAMLFGFLLWQSHGQGASFDGPLTPEQVLAAFELEPGLRVELVAAEPLTASPCALAWDDRGRLYVAENRGYPTGGPAGEPAGVIALLEDTDGDGRFDKRTEFARGLTFPNGLMPWRDGLIVTCAPDVFYFQDTDGDGQADVKRVLLTGFATNQSTQLRVKKPMLAPDGWVYLASGLSGGRITSPQRQADPPLELKGDVRFHPDTGEYEHTDGKSQFGQSFDDFGRRFGVFNRIQVQHFVLPSRYLERNPHLASPGVLQNCPELVDNPFLRGGGGAARLYPISANITTADSHAGTFSAACAIHLYRGGALPVEYDGHAFSCDPTGNLVHHDRLEPAGATFAARRVGENLEFLRSRDDWFRPVFLATGPDGALYVADMYRKVIEHPEYLPAEIRRHAGTPGVIAVQLLLMDRMLGDTWYDPIYAAACEAGLPIAVHQSGSEGCFTYSQGPAGGIPRSYGERHSVLTQVGAANVVDAVANGTFERFPGLNIVMVEWGFSWLPAVSSRLDLFWQQDPSQAPRVKRMPSEYIARHFTFTTQPLDEVGRVHRGSLFAATGLKDILLFSSDYPHYDTDSPRFVLSGQIPAEFKAAVCYENALRVFGTAALRAA